MSADDEVYLNGKQIRVFSDVFPILKNMLGSLCRAFTFNSISLVFVKNQKYLFDFFIPGDRKSYIGKTLQRTAMSQIQSDTYVTYIFLESIDLEKYLKRVEGGGSPYKMILQGGYYQIYDDEDYLNNLIEQNLLTPDHRNVRLADYNHYKDQPGFQKNYSDFSDFYKKLVLPLRVKAGDEYRIYGHVYIDQFRLIKDPSEPLDDIYIRSLLSYFDDFSLHWKTVTESFNRKYLPVFNRITKLESEISQFENPPYTMAHLDNVSVFFLYFIKWANATHKLALTQEELFSAYMGARFHDVGKVKIPIDLLNKKGKLDKNERSVIERHPQWGIELLELTDLPRLAYDIVLYHHVHLDGTGYPRCPKDLPFLVKLFTPVDIFEALVSIRPYKRRYKLHEAFNVLRNMSDKGKIDNRAVKWLIEYTEGLIETGKDFMENNHIVVMDDQKVLFDFLDSIIKD